MPELGIRLPHMNQAIRACCGSYSRGSKLTNVKEPRACFTDEPSEIKQAQLDYMIGVIKPLMELDWRLFRLAVELHPGLDLDPLILMPAWPSRGVNIFLIKTIV